MISIPQIRARKNKIVVFGDHEGIVQSMLDFDYLSGKKESSITGIVTGKSGYAKYFFGRQEFLIPTLRQVTDPENKVVVPLDQNLWFFSNVSGRRTLRSTLEALGNPAFTGGVIFAEGVPELHALKVIEKNAGLIVGPASVGLLIPGILKIGPIGGITPAQVDEGKLTEPGNIAVFSGSGGMTNELINVAIQAGHRVSFALSYGGDRFPTLSPQDAFLLAERDPETHTVLYYGELGGEDEYELVKLKNEGKFTKNVVAHIAGTVASLFPESPQFGHAKAKADKEMVTARAKRDALRSAGFSVSESFTDFISLVNQVK